MSENEKFQPFENRIDLSELQESLSTVKNEIKKVIVGQDELIDNLLVALLTGGHTLIEGVPGTAKTITAKLLAQTIAAQFSRIQFTPDLMPSDVTGTSVLDLKTNEFNFVKGPIFGNIILIDEINRAPAKTQAALFECMSERQVTVDGVSHILDAPFLVLATQNPVEHEGTYRLPEAQMDRFLFKLTVNYPSVEDEVQILKEQQGRRSIEKESLIQTVLSKEKILHFQQLCKSVFVHEELIRYMAHLIAKTRDNASLVLGASTRASLALLTASKAFAAIHGRDFVTPEDVKQIAFPVIGHRVLLTPEREMEGFSAQQIIQQIIDDVEIPH